MLKSTKLICALTLLSILILLNGCASVGREFHYENVPQLKIGEFNIEDCETVFGKPHKVLRKINEKGQFDVKQYLHAFADIGTARSRVLVLEFLNGKLNAYNFVSSFDEDRTLVNSNNLSQITQGQSKKVDVLNIMGEPRGIGICPSILGDYKDRCSDSKVAEIWTWASTRKLVTMALGNRNSGIKTVYISFDSSGVVVAIDSAE